MHAKNNRKTYKFLFLSLLQGKTKPEHYCNKKGEIKDGKKEKVQKLRGKYTAK